MWFVGSSDATLAATLKLIGVGFFFESTFGEKPPLYCTSRLPTRTFSQLPAARAAPVTTNTSAAATAANPVELPQSFLMTTSRGEPMADHSEVNVTVGFFIQRR